jgi:DNA polymerase-3 subunit delta
MSIAELDKQIANNELMNLYLFSGEENFEKEDYIKKIKKSIGELVKGINFIVLDKENITNLAQEACTYPFGYDKKLIIVNVPTKERKIKKDEDEENIEVDKQDKKDWITDEIVEILSGNLDNIYIIFSEDSISKGKLSKIVEEKGLHVIFEKKRSPELIKWAIATCAKYNITLNIDDATYIIHLCGDDKLSLINELRKLIEYTGSGNTISRESIEKLCIKTDDVIVFNLTDSLGKKDVSESLRCLDELVEGKEALQKIIILIARHFNHMLLAKTIIKQKKSVEKELELKPYPALKCSEQSKNFDCEYLSKIIKEIAKLDADSKVGKIDLMIGLQKIICM